MKPNEKTPRSLKGDEALLTSPRRIAAKLSRRIRGRRERSEAALFAVDSLEDGVLLLDCDRRIRFENAMAQSALREGNIFVSRDRKLYLRRLQDDQKLARAFSEIDGPGSNGELAFAARDANGAVWRFILSRQTHDDREFLLLWFNCCHAGRSSPTVMQQIYGLSDAELPVMAMVVEGLSASQISGKLGLSISTVRSHIQHIYSKTGVRKATQLATLVATLPRV